MKETDWHHAPLHRFLPNAMHMITASTYGKEHLFLGNQRLDFLQNTLLNGLTEYGWKPQAWACLSNHYHVIARAPGEGELSGLMQVLHSRLGMGLNEMDQISGRQVMYQYWDRCITFDKSYYARLNYVIHNPVKHGLVEDARLYPFCSAAWFERNNPKSVCRRVYSYKYDTVNEPDDFEVRWMGDA
jgi:putative transposase